ncbi:odorant receptor 94b-like [Condylostylus longicornis]|uniref:odorant receptor 94b-like n=1 Tax=Condylostylus longicornis TaxID=2530218 RepID=UPI00244DD8CD|nr:odorant receptor 94b-like [Condylostylus longicornis]
MEENFDAIQPTRSINIVLMALGVWTFINRKWFWIYRLYTYILHLIASLCFAIMMNINLVSADNLKDFLESIFMTFTLNAMMVKIINVVYYGRKVVKLMENFQDEKFKLENDKEYKIIKDSHKRFNLFKKFYIFLCLSVISTSYINGFILHKMPYVSWFPFDWRKNDTYFYYAYIYEVISMTINCLTNLNLDLFQTYILFQTGLYYELIIMRLKNIGYEHEELAMKNLIKTIKSHQLLTKISKDVETIVSAPVAVQNILSAAVICLTAYELVTVSLKDNTFEFISLLYFLVTMAFQIFLPCFYGHVITERSELLCDAIYSSNWVDVSVKMKKFIFIYMESLKRPIIIKAGSIFNVDLSVFTKTINNSYSLFALLMSLEK